MDAPPILGTLDRVDIDDIFQGRSYVLQPGREEEFLFPQACYDPRQIGAVRLELTASTRRTWLADRLTVQYKWLDTCLQVFAKPGAYGKAFFVRWKIG